MTRYKLTIEYDGRPFVGWQRQTNGTSVQQSLEEAVQAFCGEKTRVYGAGRTDAGVHALGQVAHVDFSRKTDGGTVRDALNAHLRPAPVAVIQAQAVGDGFHARTSARQRNYLYRIANRRAPLALEDGRAWHVQMELDAASMHDAAQVLVGKHDFTTFRASQCQAKSPVKTLTAVEVERIGTEILFHVRARSFLHHQVRNIVGTLKLVGEGKWNEADVKAALEVCDRSSGGPTAPPDGLYLTRVDYPTGS